MSLLLYGNHPRMAEFLKKSLENQGFSVDLAFDAHNAISLAQKRAYDLVLIDLEAPQQEDSRVWNPLLAPKAKTALLFLVRPAMRATLIEQLNVAATQVLVKPFRFGKLMGRIRSLIKAPPPTRKSLVFADVRFEPATRKLWRQGQEISLSPKEAAMLLCFLQHPNQVLTRRMMAEAVWEEPFTLDTFTNIIDVYINYLRKKMDRDFEPKLIHTVRGQGYMLKVPDNES